MSLELIKAPDIGGDSGEIIELLVNEGDQIALEQSLVVLESAKASMEVPSPVAGRVKRLLVKVGDRLEEGNPILEIETQEGTETQAQPSVSAEAAAAPVESDNTEGVAQVEEIAAAPSVQTADAAGAAKEQLFKVPDLGSESAQVIEISVAPGDRVAAGDTLVVAESDKASLEIPAEADGEIVALHLAVGDKISQGTDLATLRIRTVVAKQDGVTREHKPEPPLAAGSPASSTPEPTVKPPLAESVAATPAGSASGDIYAGPAVRQLARELGVDLRQVKSSGPRGRLLKEDLQAYVKSRMQQPATAGAGAGIPAVADVDWTKFGTVRAEATTRIQRLTADNMVRAWLNVPHVTQFDDADVSELEDYRAMMRHEASARGIKMTPLAFILRAAYKALKANPRFNASISADGQSIIYREFFHIGVAVDTPAGLVVPVVRDVDQKDIWALAAAIAELAEKAKSGKLKPTEMQGACFTISSLGAIGGRGFTPIVPAPQVGILGVSRTSVQPVWDGKTFAPRKLMPLALSYDHRAVNGADAGRFLTYLVEQLGSVENILVN